MSNMDEAVGTLETMVEWHHLDGCESEVTALIADWRKRGEALAKIERWFGEFPETGRFWDGPQNTQPMSYGANYGSDGERDFMRDIARAALTPQQPPQASEK